MGRTAFGRSSILNPNPRRGCPIVATNVVIARLTFSVKTLRRFFCAISYREWPFPGGEVRLPAIFVLSRVIVANRPLCGAMLFRTLISDAGLILSASPRSSHRRKVFFCSGMRPALCRGAMNNKIIKRYLYLHNIILNTEPRLDYYFVRKIVNNYLYYSIRNYTIISAKNPVF